MRIALPVLLSLALSLVGLGSRAPFLPIAGPPVCRAAGARPDGGSRPAGHAAAGRARAAAQPLLDRAMAALAAHDLNGAAGLFAEAYRSSPRPEVLYQLGRLAVEAGRPLEAHDLFRRYLADPTREPDDEATKTAEQFIAQPPPASGSVTVLSDPGALVVVDGRVVGVLPLQLPLLLSPGPHTLNLELPNKRLEAPLQVQENRFIEVRFSRASGAVLVTVLPTILLITEGEKPVVDAARPLFDAIEQAARGEQHTILRAEQALITAGERPDCLRRESCQRQLAEKNKTDSLLRQQIATTGDPKRPSWSVQLVFLRTDVDEPAASGTLTCAACTAEQLAKRGREEVARLLSDGLTRSRGELRVTTEPAGATLRLGDRPPIRAPLHASLWVGSYPLEASQPGYSPEQRTIEIVDGKPTELQLALTRLAGPAPPVVRPSAPPVPRLGRLPRPKWRLGLGGAMLGAGLAIGVIGLVGIAADGQCVTPPMPEGAACPQLRDTRPVGGFSFFSGLVLMGSGIVLMSIPGPRR